jgi:hypothetical protein
MVCAVNTVDQVTLDPTLVEEDVVVTPELEYEVNVLTQLVNETEAMAEVLMVSEVDWDTEVMALAVAVAMAVTVPVVRPESTAVPVAVVVVMNDLVADCEDDIMVVEVVVWVNVREAV